MKLKIILLLGGCMYFLPMNAQLSMPAFFTDNMVLQRNVLIPVWGKASANEKLELKFHNQVKVFKADKNGNWMTRLDGEAAGGPYELSIKGKNSLLLKNILVGEVWLCGGQSNMEWSVGQSDNAATEIKNAQNPFIRHIKIQHQVSSLPAADVKTDGWKVCSTATVADFTAVGYFFAKRIYDSIGVPVGLINDCWGGTNIETWISREAFESSDEFKAMIAGMPKVNLDSITQLMKKINRQRIELLQGAKINEGAANTFKDPSFDDSQWPQLNAPQQWENQAIGDLDGVVWLRKTIMLSESDSKKNAVLELAKIDDDDITYVNGIKVGNTNQWDAKRKYNIPAGVLKAGQNVIAIRVVDNTGGGGIWGDAADLQLKLGDASIALTGNWKWQVEQIQDRLSENSLPSLCYNAMIHPLIPFAFKGVLWYQGESNADRAWQYRTAFPLLIQDWRKQFNNENAPFYFVQLASFVTDGNSNNGCAWAELREAQANTLQLPNTAMCVTTDLVKDPKDIHPTNKQDVGKRLAAFALNSLYSKKMVCAGPGYNSMQINGGEVILSFNNTGTGLFTPDKYGCIKGFEIAGADSVFHFARAFIKGNQVVVGSENVNNPVAVRFGWMGDAVECNLFNKEGFPAVPFRTDTWKTITKGNVYKIAKFK
ncbi:MAG: 9-O-acetylesterase [Ferruginibacter sp.]|nr:9-O-acetylesterase [Ferruginibacter sp.]